MKHRVGNGSNIQLTDRPFTFLARRVLWPLQNSGSVLVVSYYVVDQTCVRPLDIDNGIEKKLSRPTQWRLSIYQLVIAPLH